MKVYTQAVLFKYKTDVFTNGETAPKEGKDDQPGTNREEVIHNDIIQNGFIEGKTDLRVCCLFHWNAPQSL